jgi:hypothetical protein
MLGASMLLIEYLENASEYLRKKTESRNKLEAQYRRLYDRDIKREIAVINREIAKKKSEVNNELLLNLEEFRYLDKYFPELLEAFMEDDYVGTILSKKAWMLRDLKVGAKEAAQRLQFLTHKRAQLKDAKRFLKKWIGSVDSRAFCATFPALKGHLEADLEKDEVARIIDDADAKLRREGWILLVTDSLIRIPIAKFSNKFVKYKYREMEAQAKMKRARGKGTVSEAAALREYKKVSRRKSHYENLLIQILLANPPYLRALKKKKDWLSRKKGGVVEKIAELVTPHQVKERAWLNEMSKKLAIEEPAKPKKPAKKKTAKKKPVKKKTKKKK